LNRIIDDSEYSLNIVEYTLRTVAILVATVLHGIVFLVHRLFSGTANITYRHVRSWCTHVLQLAGVRVVMEGSSQLSASESYIFISNHASLFDIPSLLTTLPGNVRIMYKKELEKIPFMGWALKFSTFVPIVREKTRDALSTVEHTIQLVRSDASSLIVFAEGTRTPDGLIQKFKRGAFILGIKSGKPIVPVAIIGSFNVLPKTTLRFNKGEIRVRIGTPMRIAQREYSRAEEIELMNKVRAEVLKLSNESVTAKPLV
jgi:1-acyl-sn-glycerol-3-phosphate acyltransferase